MSLRAPVKRILSGAIDMHCHPGPDLVPRVFDIFELVSQMEEIGMSGFVAKNHSFPTSALAQLVNKKSKKVKAFGSVTLNHPVGGLNPAAVRVAAKMGGKVVWFPTLSSEHSMKRGAQGAVHKEISDKAGSLKGIRITKDNGDLLPETEAVLEVIAEEGLVLATGHISRDETLALVEGARRAGARKVIATHVDSPITYLSEDDLHEVTKNGAFVEHGYGSLIPFARGETRINPPDQVERIKKGGVNKSILSTDSGVVLEGWPHSTNEAWTRYLQILLSNGLAESDLALMTQSNPRHLLGLD